MVQKSYGKMRGTRKKMAGSANTGVVPYLRKFGEGDHVHISFLPGSRKVQHPRFQGLTGRILEKRGRNYVVEVRHGSVMKKIFVRPESLKAEKVTKK